jgi:hypothetical protein
MNNRSDTSNISAVIIPILVATLDKFDATRMAAIVKDWDLVCCEQG